MSGSGPFWHKIGRAIHIPRMWWIQNHTKQFFIIIYIFVLGLHTRWSLKRLLSFDFYTVQSIRICCATVSKLVPLQITENFPNR